MYGALYFSAEFSGISIQENVLRLDPRPLFFVVKYYQRSVIIKHPHMDV